MYVCHNPSPPRTIRRIHRIPTSRARQTSSGIGPSQSGSGENPWLLRGSNIGPYRQGRADVSRGFGKLVRPRVTATVTRSVPGAKLRARDPSHSHAAAFSSSLQQVARGRTHDASCGPRVGVVTPGLGLSDPSTATIPNRVLQPVAIPPGPRKPAAEGRAERPVSGAPLFRFSSRPMSHKVRERGRHRLPRLPAESCRPLALSPQIRPRPHGHPPENKSYVNVDRIFPSTTGEPISGNSAGSFFWHGGAETPLRALSRTAPAERVL